MRALLVHNDKAGKDGKGRYSSRKLQRLLRDAGYTSEVRRPKDPEIRDAAHGTDLIVVAGGDGTVTKVATVLKGDDPPVAILPLGTANNIATALGIRGSPEEEIARWPSAARRRIDTWIVKGRNFRRPCIEGCGVGALTQGIHRFDEQEKAGETASHEVSMARATVGETVTSAPALDARVVLDHEELYGKFVLLELLNFRAIGPGLVLAPQADPSDGLLDVAFVREEDRVALFRWITDSNARTRSPIQVRRTARAELVWSQARLRIGDGYWPSLGKPEPTKTQRLKIRHGRHTPLFLVPALR